VDLLELFKWGMTRETLEANLGANCIPHPDQNAFGLEGDLYGGKSFTVLGFISTRSGSKLVRITLAFDAKSMPDDQVEALYQTVRKDIVVSYGLPHSTAEYEEKTPPEFRFSQMLQWKTRDSVLSLTKKLLKHGFGRESVGVGFMAYDKTNDPLARITK
jgi:hypothetical protein